MDEDPLHDPRMLDLAQKMAVDLSKAQEASATDLSWEAVEARDVRRRVARAVSWGRRMNRTFRGIQGKPPRKVIARRAMERERITEDEIDRAREYFRKQQENDDA